MPARYSFADAEFNRWPILSPVETDVPFYEPVLSVALDRPVCVVGARVLVHLPLTSRQVSKSQALIVIDTNGVYLRDLSSKNQTRVNDQPVCEAWLEKGDTVQFGPHKYQCQSGFEPRGEPIPIPLAELRLAPDGLGSRRTMPLEQYTFLIGSRYGCDLMLQGADISLAHAVIFVRESRRYLRDLSSLTGTFVNDQPIGQVELGEGDQIRIGTSQLKYHSIEATRAEESVQQRPEADEQEIEEDVLAGVADAAASDATGVFPLHDESPAFAHSQWGDKDLKVHFDGDEYATGSAPAESTR